MKKATKLMVLFFGWASVSGAQWSNRYPKIEGYSHHVYLEGFELPVMGVGPTDPAPSPDGRTIAFAARGWLWLMELENGKARRLTSSGAMDSRPAWSPDGERLAFLRDNTEDTDIFVLDLGSGRESPLVNTCLLYTSPSPRDS